MTIFLQLGVRERYYLGKGFRYDISYPAKGFLIKGVKNVLIPDNSHILMSCNIDDFFLALGQIWNSLSSM